MRSLVSQTTRSMCETIAAKLEESWQPIVVSGVSKRSKKDQKLAGKRKQEFNIPIPKAVKTQESETVDTCEMKQHHHHQHKHHHQHQHLQQAPAQSTLVAQSVIEVPKPGASNDDANENVSMEAESVPSSPSANATSLLQTPPQYAEEQTSPSPQNLQAQGGPKIFVSEMLINQRELYLEIVSRSSGDSAGADAKFQICETSLDVPDLAFSAISCALAFSSSELWSNIQVRIKI